MADVQNPWLTGGTEPAVTTPGSTVGQPAPGWGPGATILSEGPAWLKPENQASKDLSEYLDASKWQEWGDDEWRAATGGYGFEGGLMGQLEGLMGASALKNQIQTYGVGGSRYAPGRYDFATKKMVYDNVPPAALAAANAAAKYNGGDMSNPGGTGVWADKTNPVYAALSNGLSQHKPSTTGPAPINYSGVPLGNTSSPRPPTLFTPPAAPPRVGFTTGTKTQQPAPQPVAAQPRAPGPAPLPYEVASPRPSTNTGAVAPTATMLRRNMFMP